MSQIDKLKRRLVSKPSDFRWDELVKVLAACGFSELPTGTTGGSRRKFYNEKTEELISLHQPHPEPVLKRYQVAEIAEKLGKRLLE